MNDTVQNLVQAIRAGDALETENAFTMAMQEKLSAKLDDMRQSVAQSMFAEESLPGSHQAAQIAHNVASSTKQKVSSFGGQHFIHKPNDDSSSVMIHHKNNQFHVTHDDGQINHTKSFDNAKDAHKYTHSLMSENYNISEEEYELDEASMFGAIKTVMKNKGVGDDTHGRYDTPRATQAAARKKVVAAKKVIKTGGGDYSKVAARANAKTERENEM